MILTGHQPNYLPYLGLLHKIAHADTFLIVDTVQFVKRGPFGWIHRNRIRTHQGWMWLSLPVKTHGRYHQTIAEAELDNKLPWARKHLRSISMAYAKAPHFEDHRPFLEEVYARSWTHLAPLCEAVIRYLIEAFQLDVEVLRLSDLESRGKASELIVNFCRELGAETYLSGVHGQDYLDQEAFEKAGIRLVFQEFQHPVYPQCHPGDFVPDLSAIDLLFNAGPRSPSILLGEDGSHDPDLLG